MKTKNDIKLIKYFWKMIWNMNPGFIGVMLGSCVIHGFFPFVNVIFPMYIIDELVTHKRCDML